MSTEISKVTASNLPAHLQDFQGETGLEGATQYMSPSRLKVLQDKKGEDFDAFDVGSVIVTPSNIQVCGKDGAYTFTPLFFFDEFCIHNPWNMRDTLDMIRERTFDPKSELAEKCRALTAEPCPENDREDVKYMTHLNMAIVIHGIPDLEDILILASFYGGEFKTGRAMIDLLRVRCSQGQPIYSTVLQATPAKHKSKDNKNRWEGQDITNPAADMGEPWVIDPEKFILYGKMAAQVKSDKERIITLHEHDGAKAAESVEGSPTTDTL